jgi:ferredoxin-thioredoxin reductase catalytic subunit
MNDISKEKINQVYKRLDKYAESHGYHLNPDIEFTKDLIKSLLINQKRYSYWACPCRLASGKREEDEDII